MANLKEIRTRIKSVITTQQMTKAMKMVAAAKLRRAQDKIQNFRPYAKKLKEIMGDISANLTDGVDSPYAQTRKVENVLLVIVTSNRGLCGAFNANVNRLTTELLNGEFADLHKQGKVSILAIGKKGYEFFSRRNLPMIGENHDVFADLSFGRVDEVADIIMDGFIAKKWDQVHLVFNEFKNVVSQVRTVEQFLPIVPDAVADAGAAAHANADFIFEPEKEKILEDLIPRSLKVQLFRAVLETNAGEQGARMSAMDSATENANELLKSLRLTYNRARQAAITTEILEIVAGAEALASAG